MPFSIRFWRYEARGWKSGAGNPLDAGFEDMKQEDENGGASNPLNEAVFEDMKQEDENGGAGNPLGENAVFEDMKQEDENQEPVTLSVKMPFLKIWNKRMKMGSR